MLSLFEKSLDKTARCQTLKERIIKFGTFLQRTHSGYMSAFTFPTKNIYLILIYIWYVLNMLKIGADGTTQFHPPLHLNRVKTLVLHNY